MNHKYISIKIEGDFIDSFIYSGILFLVSANSQISIYNWEGLLSNISDRRPLYNFLKDCRKGLNLVEGEYQEIYIEEEQLKEHKLGETLRLKVWSTDINVYSNRLYIADENGVDRVNLDFGSKRLAQDTRLQLWDKYAYKISPNDNSRIAIAAGSNGIITAFPRNTKIIGGEDIKTIEINSYDCEWIGKNLITNSKDGAYISVFAELPKKPREGKIPDSFYPNLNRLKRQTPETIKIDNDSQASIIYSWMAGRKLFSLLNNGEVIRSEVIGKYINVLQDIKTNNTMPLKLPISSRVLVRSGLFGAVIEIGDNLFSLTESGFDPISHRPVSWRVFPRAKNYLNHLHIVENDHLAICAYFVSSEDDSDNYGISFNEVSQE
ncbi:hypothetical protein [Spirulina sp. 06S082]|uniref:hypothetical protein n=1 Tax=Spirulina sp. 06S082 TaxID=3110248 RepID=UPI002B1F4A18|nr:hypothetical protein [Spirulina sp. 06S082]MEA5471540.1 hypothetical protein [Spirulina sp. 06S082]